MRTVNVEFVDILVKMNVLKMSVSAVLTFI